MSAAAVLPVLLPIFKDVLAPIIDRAVNGNPPPVETAEAVVETKAEEAAQAVAAAVNDHMSLIASDAASADRFRSWWRPALMWIIAAAVFHDLLIRDYVTVLILNLLPGAAIPPRAIPADVLWPLIFGVLGIAGLRTFEKGQGTDSTVRKAVTAAVSGAIKRAGK